MSAVSEIMSPKKLVVASIKRNPSALDIAKLMVKSRVGSVVLVDGDGKPVGIVTERDLLRKVSASNKPARGITARSIMSSPVVSIMAYDSVETAAAVMAKKKVKRVVVVEDIARKLARILADDYDRYGRMKAVLDL
jgi:CBS domain-containing protein